MRTPNLAVLVCLALAACDHDPAFDASSPGAYERSLSEITAKLSAEERRRLDMALLTLALGNTAQSNALELANSASLNDLVRLNGVANPLQYLDRVRPGINGRSATAVIRYVTADLDDQISRAEAQSAGAYRLLSAVVIDHPRYYWDSRRKLPAIEFSVFNGSKNAISRIYVSGVLTVPRRSGKWVTGGLNYKFERGLEPGVQTQVTLAPRVFSTRTAEQLERFYDADISVQVTNIEDVNGKKLLPVDADILEGMRNKKDFLRGS
jgi:hypothetical protein